MSEFLKKRYPLALGMKSGLELISYFRFEPTAKDALTGDVNEAVAYDDPVKISGEIKWEFSPAMRARLGREQTFDAMIICSSSHLAEQNVTVKIGDAFVIPNHTEKFYCEKVEFGKLLDGETLDTIIAIKRGVNRRD